MAEIAVILCNKISLIVSLGWQDYRTNVFLYQQLWCGESSGALALLGHNFLLQTGGGLLSHYQKTWGIFLKK